MGFFSGLRRKVKKLIPKEVRPFVPYLLAGMSGGATGLGAKLGLGNLAPMYQKALIAGGSKFLSDDEANLKDVGITSLLAAGPSALESYGGTDMMGNEYAKSAADKMATSKFTTLAAQGGIDAGIKAAELNEDALAKYNADLARQGINDKAGRRAAIRAIYSNTGTWDMDEVDGMLDTYGYRTGGRVGYADGDFVGEDNEAIDKDVDGILSMKDLVEATIRNKDEDMEYEDFDDSLTYAKKGYDMLYPEIEAQPIRELRLADGGSTSDRLMERVKNYKMKAWILHQQWLKLKKKWEQVEELVVELWIL